VASHRHSLLDLALHRCNRPAQTALEDADVDLERIHDWVTELAASLHR
jgi:hypothetical protein